MHQTSKSTPFYRMPRKAYAVLCLLLVFSLQFLSTDLHRFLHHHDTESLHSSAREQDACHRAIYHAVKQEGCHHSAHITSKTTCLVDQLCVSSDNVEPIRFSFRAVVVFGFSFIHLPQAPHRINWPTFLHGRRRISDYSAIQAESF